MGEGFQSDKINCRQTYGFICTATLCSVTGNFSEASKKLAPATKKVVGSQATPGSGSRRNFSEASKILHLPHKKNVGK